MAEPMLGEATSEARSWRDRSLAQLTLVRFREFLREPEAVFWTFAFPIILALGLGIAFRNKPADVIAIGVVTGTPAGDSLKRTSVSCASDRSRQRRGSLVASRIIGSSIAQLPPRE